MIIITKATKSKGYSQRNRSNMDSDLALPFYTCTLSLKVPQFCCSGRHCFGKDPQCSPYLLQVINPSFSCCLPWLCLLAQHPTRGEPSFLVTTIHSSTNSNLAYDLITPLQLLLSRLPWLPCYQIQCSLILSSLQSPTQMTTLTILKWSLGSIEAGGKEAGHNL